MIVDAMQSIRIVREPACTAGKTLRVEFRLREQNVNRSVSTAGRSLCQAFEKIARVVPKGRIARRLIHCG